VYVGRVCPAAGCKTNFQICIEVTVATHPTRNLVEFQHTPAGHTRPTYTVYFWLKSLIDIFLYGFYVDKLPSKNVASWEFNVPNSADFPHCFRNKKLQTFGML
jgi:hypothetical protein